jgi:hypothetical protein
MREKKTKNIENFLKFGGILCSWAQILENGLRKASK